MSRILLLLLVSFSFLGAQTFDCHVNFPHQEAFQAYWSKLPESAGEKEVITDFLPDGKNLENAEETFTIQAYQFDTDFDIKLMYERFITTLEENIDPPELLHYVLHDKDKKALFFEWWVSAPYKDAQHEWIKLLKDDQNKLAIVRFQSKKEAREESEQVWIECVSGASISAH